MARSTQWEYHKYSPSYLCDIVYGNEPMTRELAETLHQLRVEERMSHREIGSAICDHPVNPDLQFEISYYLSPIAASYLHEEFNSGWR
ncbi:MAG: hypothetical protein K9N48_07890 [Verrucomicrobia bacterium]|nr:hypothetical protein [Verrucomicrobiota bacterium]MCF7709362.1 hypothetical protein [Verrucomicrobiota bacterium]